MLSRLRRPAVSVLRVGTSAVQARFSGGYDGFDAKKNKKAKTSPIPSNLFDAKSGELHSVERVLDTYVPEAERIAVKKILYGLNQGKLVEKIGVPAAATAIAKANDFDISLSKFEAAPDGRPPRVVRFGVTQNCIVSPTDAPIEEQYLTLEAKHEKFVDAAAAAGCNVLCFQEAWTMPFAFCTREKLPWSEFAECAETGPSVKACQRWAIKHNMVIVSPILERDHAHGDCGCGCFLAAPFLPFPSPSSHPLEVMLTLGCSLYLCVPSRAALPLSSRGRFHWLTWLGACM
eukprot:m.183833 g.183833  ORF g.183833 m.183833 type:complete len:289 (-) comp24673_c0_seq1:764-1630(-)